MKQKAVFLDRDGTLIKLVYNKEDEVIDTVNNAAEVEFTSDIVPVLEKLKDLGYLLIIISNQPRVGIKKLTLETYEEIKVKVTQVFKEKGIEFDGEYYCMHHPWADIEEYRQDCECRKPKTGLIKQAQEEHNIDLSQSWVIGDGVNDIKAGKAAGLKTILRANIEEAAYLEVLEEQLGGVKPDFLIKKPKEILDIIQN